MLKELIKANFNNVISQNYIVTLNERDFLGKHRPFVDKQCL